MKYLLHLVSEFMTTKAFHLREEALELERLSRSLKAHIREVEVEEKDRRAQKIESRDTNCDIKATGTQRLSEYSGDHGAGRNRQNQALC